MKAKQTVILVAAQYAAKARAMTRDADLIAKIAEMLDESGAQSLLEKLQRSGLVDSEGVLVDNASFDESLLKKTGLS